MRINIALPLPRPFKYELDKMMGPLRKLLYSRSPHYLWLDKEEWRVTLGFFGKASGIIDAELVCAAVKQAVIGFGPITGATGKFKTFGPPAHYRNYGMRNTVGVTFERGNDRMAELSGRIAEKMNNLLPNKYVQITHPYITLLRKGRLRRPALPTSWVDRLKLNPLECGFNKVAVYISDKQPFGSVHTLQKPARLF